MKIKNKTRCFWAALFALVARFHAAKITAPHPELKFSININPDSTKE